MYLYRLLPPIALMLIAPAWVYAQESASSAGGHADAELREAIRLYDDALRRADVAAAERFWADEYVFINPRGERVSREDRVANLREKRTSFGSLAHEPKEETLTIDGRYSGEAERGEFRALVVWIRRDGRWQQLASQMTPILKPGP